VEFPNINISSVPDRPRPADTDVTYGAHQRIAAPRLPLMAAATIALPARTPPPARTRSAWREPAWWLFTVLITFGLVELLLIFGPGAVRHPAPLLFAAVIFGLHGAFLIWILRHLDYLEPEPVALLAAALAWGGIVATSNAVRANIAADSILTKLYPLTFVQQWGPAIEGPTNEEILKSLGIVALILLARRQLNSVMDGVIFGAFVGIGFQEVENIVYSLNAVAGAGTNSLSPVWQVFVLRGLFSGLWSHAVYSAIVGAGIAYAVLRRDRPMTIRVAAAALGFLGGWSAHFLWNSPLFTDILSGAGGGLGTVVSMLIKGGLILSALLVIIHFARGSEYRALASHLYRLDDVRVAPVGDIRALRTARTRHAARWNAYVSGGLAGTRATRRLQRSQADLASHLVRVDESPATASAEYPAIAQALAQISIARAQLDPIGIAESDTSRARGTWAGWLAMVGGAATIFTPYAIVVPIVLAVWRVRAARQARRNADPRLLTGLLIGVALLVVWLAFHAVGAERID
jgi:RsiW-degrading membrane proteinase PrsW (M82 family)